MKYGSASVHIVHFMWVCGRIGHIGRNDLCQRCATPELCQISPSRFRVSQCRTRVRIEHLFRSVFARPGSLRGETGHR
jgi:hypothetical protein